MGKNRKRKRCLPEKNNNTADADDVDTTTCSLDDENIEDQISQEDLDITIATLQKIGSSKNPPLHAKRFKLLRKVVHPLAVQQLQSYHHGTDFRIKVTQFLAIQHWSDALAALQGCQDFGQIPKQGTIQRWVRDCDLCTVPCKLQLLNAILTLANPSITTNCNTDTSQHVSKAQDDDEHESMDEHINRHDPRIAILALHKIGHGYEETDDGEASTTTRTEDADLEIMADWSIGRLMTTVSNNDNCKGITAEIIDWNQLPMLHLTSKILYQETASERIPPNHYDLLLHTTNSACIEWSDSPPAIIKHQVPFLESQKGNAFLLENVLTVDECQQLRAAATQMGWRPDHPISLDQPTGIDSCEWLVDDSILSVINARVRPHLPHSDMDTSATVSSVSTLPVSTTVSGVTRFHSINPRWRFFRYGPHCVYRPHIDGSWPASRIDANGRYECYSQGTDGSTIKSYHTFLIYLNDNFQGGQTRFYVPKNRGDDNRGRLIAQGVTPKCGSVLVFSQGNTASLLHEGSAVTQGQKFVIRTDVLYETSPEKRNSSHHKKGSR